MKIKIKCATCKGLSVLNAGNVPNPVDCPDCTDGYFYTEIDAPELSDILDKCNDILDKCNDILEQLQGV